MHVEHCQGKAYRGGTLLCASVFVTIRHDGRLGLAPRERQTLSARFAAPRGSLAADLQKLAHRRGAAGQRLAERMDPLTLVLPDAPGTPKIPVTLAPPELRRGDVTEIHFGMRVVDDTDTPLPFS